MIETRLLRGLLGLLAWVALCYVLSRDRRAVNWRTVGVGIALQVVFALGVLRVEAVRSAVEAVSAFFVRLLEFSQDGAAFLFGPLVKDQDQFGYIFAFQVLPTIVFFSALTSILYYFQILQRVVRVFAWAMSRSMKLSGAESLSAAANVFIGQTEAPLLVKPYIASMSRSEIMALMTGGMATIAGGVLAAYIGFLGGDDPESRRQFATHLLSASLMSAPAALVTAKLLFPETQSVNYALEVSRQEVGDNLLDAIAQGTGQGLRLAVNVAAMLLVFTALMSMVNYALGSGLGEWTGLNPWIAEQTDGRYEKLSVQLLLGVLGAPLAWLMGVPTGDLLSVGFLLGEKTILNEFYAYKSLSGLEASSQRAMQPLSTLIATYALCGFANFGSIGIQIGGIGALAPQRRTLLASLGMWSLLAGTIACFMTATIAGMLADLP
jgi:CNT family concentrative nucleoside transporter